MQIQDQKQRVHATIIVAAGSGVRAGLKQGRPKQYCDAGGKPILRRTLEAFLDHPRVHLVLAVIRAGDEDLYEEATRGLQSEKLLKPVPGGATRQLSVAAGIEALASFSPDAVLIHDAARPFISAQCIGDTLDALQTFDGAIAAAPVTDTLKRGEAGQSAGTVSRGGLWRAQTPQTFHYAKIRDAHRAAGDRTDFTDDASIAEWHGLTVALVENTSENMKITTAEDLAMADLIATGETRAAFADVRSGPGSMSMPSRMAITSRFAAFTSLTLRSSRAIPTPMPACTRLPTRFMARSAPAISATISRPPIRNGAARIRRFSFSMPPSSLASAAGG